MSPRYRIFSYFGRRIFATPTKPRWLRVTGLARFQPFTFKRAAYRRLLRLAMLTRTDRYFSHDTDNPINDHPGFDFEGWLDRVRLELGVGHVAGVVFWPSETDRPRIYIHLFDADRRPIAFTKVSLDQADSEGLERERRGLQALWKLGLSHSRVPQILAHGRFGHYTYLITEPLPATARPIPSMMVNYPGPSVAEFAGEPRRVAPENTAGLSWWAGYRKTLDEACRGFDQDLTRSISSRGVRVARAHGDMGPANLTFDRGRVWIYDWEHYCQDAPVMTDEMSYYLAINYVRNLADPIAGLRELRDRYLQGVDEDRRGEVLAALAFRAASGLKDVPRFMRHWAQLERFSE